MAVLTTRVQRFFHLFFLSTTIEKLSIPYKAFAAVQAFKVCKSCPAGKITLQDKLKAADESLKLETALSSSVNYVTFYSSKITFVLV